jgi:hypothetical protein
LTRRTAYAAALVTFVVGVFAVVMDRLPDVNADLFNYHYFMGYAVLHGRFFDDIAPAGLQTFFNPLPNALAYLSITYLTFPWSAFPTVAIQLLSLPLLCLVLRELRFELGTYRLGFDEVLALAICLMAPMWWSELGTSLFSATTAPLVMLGVLLLLRAIKQDLATTSGLRMFMAGAAFGLAAGLKLTNGIFALGMLVALVVVTISMQPRALDRVAGVVCCGMVAGFALTGLWNLYLAWCWGSPLYPLYNAIFRSPYFELVNFRDTRWGFDSVQDFFSFVWMAGSPGGSVKTSESVFTDARLPLAVGLLTLVALVASKTALTKGQESHPIPRPASRLLLLFTVSTTVFWAATLAYQRYFIGVELLLGAALWIAVRRLVQNRFAVTATMALMAGVVGCVAQYPEWGHAPFSGKGEYYFQMTVPERLRTSPADYLIAGNFNSFALPFFDPRSRFLRFDLSTTLYGRILSILAEGKYPVRLFTNEGELPHARLVIAQLGYVLAGPVEECTRFTSSRDHYLVCDVRVMTR